MISGRIVIKKSSKDDAEKPFWISYADLMTALMVLFLVVMIVSMIAITKPKKDIDELEKERQEDIQEILNKIEKISPDLTIDKKDYRINFGTKARFENGKWDIDAESAAFLRSYVPQIIALQSSRLGKKWLKRFVVEGYTSATGSYLFNLDLSLKRSQSVICTLFTKSADGSYQLALEDLKEIRDLFMVGGFAFNSGKTTEYDSRRIELRVEFWGLNEIKDDRPKINSVGFGDCQLK